MSASYGFRLFELKLRRENTRTDLPFVQSSDNATWRYSDHLMALLAANKEKRERGLPRLNAPDEEPDDDRSTQPMFQIDDFGRMGDAVTFTMSYGAQTGHDTAMADPDSDVDEDLDISRHYPSRKYRGVFIFPCTESTRGVLALERISRACPRQPLIRWVTQWSRLAAVPEGDKTPPWWKLIANPMVDQDALNRFMEQAAAETIFLKRHKVTEDRKREVDSLDLRVEIARATLRRGALEKVRQWIERKLAGDEIGGHDAAQSVAALVGDELAGVDFDETRIAVQDPISGKQKTFTPSHLPDVFTYYLGTNSPPETSDLHASIRGVVRRVQSSLITDIDWDGWPPPKE